MRGLAEATGFDDASFDLLVFSFVMHECPQAAIRDFLAEAKRVVRPGGVVVVVDNNPRCARMRMRACCCRDAGAMCARMFRHAMAVFVVSSQSDSSHRHCQLPRLQRSSKTIQNLPPVLFTLMKSTEPWSDEVGAGGPSQGAATSRQQ